MTQFKHMLQILSVLVLAWGMAGAVHASDSDTDEELEKKIQAAKVLEDLEYAKFITELESMLDETNQEAAEKELPLEQIPGFIEATHQFNTIKHENEQLAKDQTSK